MAKVVIIGAGLTGLSTAYHLEQQGFFDYAIFEQEATSGGLCRSVRTDGFTFDYTGHFFHCTDTTRLQILQALIQDSPLSNHIRRSYVYSHKTYTSYPYQTNLYGLPLKTIIDCITGFVRRSKQNRKGYFDTWVKTNFGAGFAKHFFFPYQEKIFDFPVNKLRTGWVQGVPQTSLEDILAGALQERDVHSIGYNAQFWYPKNGGIDHLINAFAKTLKNQICTHSSAVYIDPAKKIVTFSNGHTEPYEYLISTIPLKKSLHLLGMQQEAKKLLCNSVININLGINREELCSKHWVYYPEKQYAFFRIGYPHTLGSMAPEGCSSLSIEIASLAPLNQAKISALKKNAIQQVCTIFNINKQDIITEQTLMLPHAYVIYDSWREKHIDALLEHLARLSMYSIGRYGAWKYSSMHDAITDGQHMASKIIAHISSLYKPAKLVKQEPGPASIIPPKYPTKRPDHA